MKRAGIETGPGDAGRRRLVHREDPRHGRTERLQAGCRHAARLGPCHARAGRTRRPGAARSDVAAGLQPGAGGRPDEVPVCKGRARSARAGARSNHETRRDRCGQPAGDGTPARRARREAGGRAEPSIAPRAARHAASRRSTPCRLAEKIEATTIFRRRSTASSPSVPPTSV